MNRTRGVTFCLAVAGVAAFGSTGCQDKELLLPTPEDIEAAFTYEGDLNATLNGNVAEITVTQSRAQLRRGGGLWAKVGPYVVLFSDETRTLFEQYNGLAAVRVITETGGREVARAMLARDTLNEVRWRRSLNIAGLARRDGSRHPSRIEALVLWGEDHSDFEYNAAFIPR